MIRDAIQYDWISIYVAEHDGGATAPRLGAATDNRAERKRIVLAPGQYTQRQ